MPFYTTMCFCVLADGSIAYARSDRYEVRVVGPDLEPRATLSRDVPAPEVTREDRDEYFESVAERGEAYVAQLRGDIEFPKHKPFLGDLFADGPFLIVVRDGSTLDVFEGGTFLGEVSVPGFRAPRALDGDRMYRPSYSDDHLPSVVAYTVR